MSADEETHGPDVSTADTDSVADEASSVPAAAGSPQEGDEAPRAGTSTDDSTTPVPAAPPAPAPSHPAQAGGDVAPSARPVAYRLYGGLLRLTHALGVTGLAGTFLGVLTGSLAGPLASVCGTVLTLWVLASVAATLAMPVLFVLPRPTPDPGLAKDLGFSDAFRLRLSLAGAPLGAFVVLVLLLLERALGS